MEKPLVIRQHETAQEIIGVLKKSGLPASVLCPIIKTIYDQLVIENNAELQQALAEWEKNNDNTGD